MTIFLKKDFVIKHNEIKNYNIIIIHWIGGSYGHFIFRMLHKHIKNFPNINDDFSFVNGTSHTVSKSEYFSEFLPDDYKKNIFCHKDVSGNYFVIKKHCFPKINYNKFNLVNDAKLNLPITFENKSDTVLSFIRNILNIGDLKPFNKFDFVNPDWFKHNNLDKKNEIIRIFNKMIKSVHSSWFNSHKNTNTRSISVSDIFNEEKFYQYFFEISQFLGESISDKDKICDDHKKFILSQSLYQNYSRHLNKNWNDTQLIDVLLKEFNY